MRKRVLIFNQYFYPGYKAGGIIQALINLIVSTENLFDFSVVCSAFDLNEKISYADIILNSWNNIFIKNVKVNVYYTDRSLKKKEILKLIGAASPEIILINGLYGFSFMLLPLFLSKQLQKKNIITIISPRGMLQKGALQVKPLKKMGYLSLLKMTGVFRFVRWHATSVDEQNDIRNFLKNANDIRIAPEIPERPDEVILPIIKEKNHLNLIFLSVITQKKNLHIILYLLSKIKLNVQLSIYGPIKDIGYWEGCKKIIIELPQNIKVEYKGAVPQTDVYNTISKYNFFILLTKGENFGYAILESLGCGRPVLISKETPWSQVQESFAGYVIDSNNENDFISVLQKMYTMDQLEYNSMCNNAHKLAQSYYKKTDFVSQYVNLFS